LTLKRFIDLIDAYKTCILICIVQMHSCMQSYHAYQYVHIVCIAESRDEIRAGQRAQLQCGGI